MKLIADSGSTKTSWRLVESNKKSRSADTIGYNPYYFTTEKMIDSLKAELLPQLDGKAEEVTEVYFYGAGSSTPDSIEIVEKAFAAIFKQAAIFVDHDLLGAARAVCGKTAGIACILGTGSNSCAYDGEHITDNVTSLGFLLGDEGSGASLGRRLVQAYFYRDLPAHIGEAFKAAYQMDKDTIFHKVYKSEMPSRYMAQFTKFLNEYIHEPFIFELVKKEFALFVDSQVMKYENIATLPIHFVGSVAFYFKTAIEEVLAERGLTLGKIVRAPIDTLEDFHA